MEDENKTIIIFKFLKIAIITLAIITILLLIISFISNIFYKSETKKYFNNSDYEKISENSWSKEIKANSSNNYTSTNYVYDLDYGLFTKTENSNLKLGQQQIYFEFNGSKTLNINYNFYGKDSKDNSCSIIQNATYNYKNKDFSCDIKKANGSCPSKCNIINEKAEKFANEIKVLIDKAKIKHNIFS